MTKRILFVDDQPEILEGLRRALRPLRAQWQLQFATNGAQALEFIKQEPFDVIVSDMRMPVMDGAQLLQEVMRCSPNTVRLMLSGQSDEEQILRAIGPVHQYLSKPCSPDSLMNCVERACSLRELIRDPNLLVLASSVSTLPSLPRVYTQLVELLKSPEVSIKNVGELISHDLAISCRLLQLVNSCFFGWPSRIDNLTHAASLIGLDRLRALALSAGVFSSFEGKLPKQVSLDELMDRSLLTSMVAQKLMTLERRGETTLANDALLAGIVIDIGHLVLLQGRPLDYPGMLEAVRQEGNLAWDAEFQNYQVTHAQLGAYLAGLWGLPDVIVEAVAYHHNPSDCGHKEFNVLSAVHVADALIQESNLFPNWPFGGTISEAYLRSLGLEDRVNVWRDNFATFTAEMGK